MAQRSPVPKFGNWESEENVLYTAYFENARKGWSRGKTINPNDPLQNPDIVSEPEGPSGSEAVRRTHERHRSREDSDLKQFANSPARQENMNGRAGVELAPQRYGGRGVGSGESQKRPARRSGCSENSFDRSPLHYRARISGKSSGAPSPPWEGKGSYESGHATPGRSRLRPRGDESPDKGAAVPKFGDWDESNPASADGYTHIFNKVREERQAGMVPGVPTESPYAHVRKQPPSDSTKCCCFPWGRK
uniref:RPM1-interacting protein 4 n=1 Tax=Rhizophora mucronata TaxID=61149 RepID=A0A2P2JLL8_RHIMU